MRTEIFGPSGKDTDNTWASSSRLLNLYRERVGGRTVLKSVLGTSYFTGVTGTFCRAMAEVDGVIYVAQGGSLWKVASTGAASNLGTILDSAETTISGNNGKVTVAAGGSYYVWDGTTLSSPAPGRFSDFGSVTFFGQLTVLTQRNGREVQWSAVADPTSLGGLDYATTESRDDNVLRALPIGGALWMFKETSIEQWYQSGTGLSSVPGSTIDIGLKGYGLITKTQLGGFFIGSDGVAYLVEGGLRRVSDSAVETAIKDGDATRCFYYEDEAHKFCVIRFSDRPAWVFDITTSEWHERGEGNSIGPWTSQEAVKAYGKFYVCTITGDVLELTRNNKDHASELVRRAVGKTVEFGGIRARVSRLEFLGKYGRGASPKITLRCSGDFGQTWRVEREKSLGALGDTDHRVIFRALGSYVQFTPELTWSDEYDLTLDASVLAEVA